MTSAEIRLQRILEQQPELEGLRYDVKRPTLMYSPLGLSVATTETDESTRYLYTFYAPTGGGSDVEIKITVDEQGQVLKHYSSKGTALSVC